MTTATNSPRTLQPTDAFKRAFASAFVARTGVTAAFTGRSRLSALTAMVGAVPLTADVRKRGSAWDLTVTIGPFSTGVVVAMGTGVTVAQAQRYCLRDLDRSTSRG